jgi:hypothetical protein
MCLAIRVKTQETQIRKGENLLAPRLA